MLMIKTAARCLVKTLLIAAFLTLASCAAPPQSRERTASFDQAIDAAVDDLFGQTQKLPAFLVKVESKLKQIADRSAIVVDPMLDGVSGQQTEVTRKAERRLVERVQARFMQFAVLPFNASEVSRAQYVLNGTITQDHGRYRLSLALTEFKSGLVIAQSAARITDTTLDTSPTAFYKDSPVLAKDRIVEGYIRTSETKAGLPADQIYLERLPTSAILADAIAAYNAERYADSLALYETASKRTDGQQLRIYNGLYLANSRLNRTAEAEKAFGVVVRLGLATNNLSVKFLFRPGSTEFLNDPKITGAYPMWIRQIARQVVQANQCVSVVGHTSRTGNEQVNDRLSLERAVFVKKRLEQEEPELMRKLREEGKGFRENIIGTGSDDARDALDRRVEFRVARCDA